MKLPFYHIQPTTPAPSHQHTSPPRLAERKVDSLRRPAPELLRLLRLRPPAYDVVLVLDRHALGHVVDLVDADEAGGELEHVVPEGDDDELGVLGALLDVVGDDGHLCVVAC